MAVPSSPYWKHAPWVFVAMLSVVAIRIHELFPMLSPFRPVVSIAFGGAAILIHRTGRKALRSMWRYTPTRLILLYFVWIGVTVPFGLWPSQSAGVMRSMISPILLFMAAMLCAPTRSNLEKVLWGAVVGTSLYLFLMPGADLVYGHGWRLRSGGAYDPNDVATLAASVFPLAVGLFARNKGMGRILAATAGGVLIFGIVQTGSRGGILALMAGALVITLGLRGGRMFFVLSALTIGGLVAWNQAPAEFRDRMATLTNLSEDYNVQEEGGRIQVWKRARGYIRQYPIFGTGAGNFMVAEGDWLAAQGRTGKWSTTHNAYLQAASELGVIGGCLFTGLLLILGIRAFSLWRVPKRVRKRSGLVRPEILASLVACAVGAIFLSMAYSWILFAVTAWVALADRVNSAEIASARIRAGSLPNRQRHPPRLGYS